MKEFLRDNLEYIIGFCNGVPAGLLMAVAIYTWGYRSTRKKKVKK